jgi:hypothetical protein
LILAMISAVLAGCFWTIGHLAGPVTAVYLWADGRRRCRLAAAGPLAASLIAVAICLVVTSSRMDAKFSFHGRGAREAIGPVQGLSHTAQAVTENLVFGNLGLAVSTTPAQGAILTLALCALWLRGRASGPFDLRSPLTSLRNQKWTLRPLECAGAALVLGSYLMEFTFRGYMEYRYLRTVNLRFIVPWYSAVPQIGAVLWLAGWWAAETMETNAQLEPERRPRFLSRWGGLGIAVLICTMVLLHRPRVDYLVRSSVPPLLPSEQQYWPIARLQMMRANILLQFQANWQHATLGRLDRAETLAKRAGIGRDVIRSAFGHPALPASVVVLRPEMYNLYDTIALLDLPEQGSAVHPRIVREELKDFFAEVEEPRPPWLQDHDPWPPPSNTGDHE